MKRHTRCHLSTPSLFHVLRGVAVASKISESNVQLAAEWLALGEETDDGFSNYSDKTSQVVQSGSVTLTDLQTRSIAIGRIAKPPEVRQLASLTIAVTFLRETSRQGLEITENDINLVWGLIFESLTEYQPAKPICSVSRSAQGFLAIPLCSLLKDGNIDELFRLHVWMPDGQRGASGFEIHSHQPYAQSWILVGEGTDHRFEVRPTSDHATATKAEYTLAWSDGKTQNTDYKTHQVSSTVVNTHKDVVTKRVQSELHSTNDTYTIPSATFHTTEVDPSIFHATLFFFDAHRGFDKNARVLGPKDIDSSHQIRDPNGLTVQGLAASVKLMRDYEQHMQRGQRHSEFAELEFALREFDVALNLIQSASVPMDLGYYRDNTYRAIGVANRRLGRYKTAQKFLETALKEIRLCPARASISGELGVVYRHMNLLDDAKRAAQIEYDTASQLGSLEGMCRAVGTLGMINYQLSQEKHDKELLKLAIKQLTERVESARTVAAASVLPTDDRKMRAKKAKSSIKREFIGLSRLSLCYTALGDLMQAQAAALESLNLTYDLDDPTDVAMSHFFYGRSLLRSGKTEEALTHFNAAEGCSPAVMLCQEPSEEHRGYLQEMIAADANIDIVDEQGYAPLDYAIFNDDAETLDILLNALRSTMEGEIESQLVRRQKRAKIQKGYRELYQEHLRPLLLKGEEDVFPKLRSLYAEALLQDPRKEELYDKFKFISYTDFLAFGRLPRSTDGLTREFVIKSRSCATPMPSFIIFFSYRWINQDPKFSLPDDPSHTQYNRMISALQNFLEMHQELNPDELGVWVVGLPL